MRPLLLAAAVLLPFAAPRATGAGLYNDRHVLIIGVDGLRADALQQQVQNGNAPNIAGLIANGTVTWTAHAGGDLGGATQQPTISGPGWSSILSGTYTNRHHVIDNSSPAYDQPTVPGSYMVSLAPHFARRLEEAKPGTYVSSIASWSWIEDYFVAAQPSYLDYHAKATSPSEEGRDSEVVAKTVANLTNANPDVVFLHLDQCDGAGHGYGYSTTVPQYMTAVANIDGLVGTILNGVNARPNRANEQWLIILTTDHGGNGTGHGGQSAGERTIPFIVSGAGVPVGVSTASPGHAAVPATAMRYLGLSIPAAWNLAEDGFVTGPAFTATRSGHTAQLSWSMPANGVPGLTGYEVRRNGTTIGTYTLAQTNMTDSAPVGGTNNYELVLLGTAEASLKQSVLLFAAGQLVWDDANSNNAWNTTATNWTDGEIFANGNEAFFTGATGEVVTVDAAGVTPSAVTITGNGSYTFSGGSLLGGTLSKTGSGTLTLSAANGFTAVSTGAGPNTQAAAAFTLGNFGALGSGTVTLTNAASMTALYFLPAIGSGTLVNNLVLSSPAAAVTTRFLTDETNVTATLSGLISGGNANQEFLVDNDSSSNDVGKIRLTNAANTFTAFQLRVNRGGLVVTSDGALGNTTNDLFLDVTSDLANSGLVLEGALTLNAARSYTIKSQTVVDTQATDDILEGPVNYLGQLVKRGTGVLTLKAAGTGTGGISLLQGTVKLDNVAAMGTGPLAVATTAAAGFLDASGLPTTATLANAISLPVDTAVTNRTVKMAGGSGRQLEFSGIISGGSAANTVLFLDTTLQGDAVSTFLLSGTNTFSGKVQVNRGGLAVNSNASLGAATNALVIDSNNGATLGFTAPMTFTHPTTLSTDTFFATAANAVDITAVIGGGSALTKTGSGILTLSAANGLTGAVIVSDGQLRVNGSLTASVTNGVTVAAAGTLSGTGTLNRALLLNGRLAPGTTGPGTLNVGGALTLAGGSTATFDLSNWTGAAGTGYDTVTTTGVNMTATAASKFTVTINSTGLTNFTEEARSFVLASSTAAPTGVLTNNWTVISSGFTGTWSLQTSGNNLVLAYQPAGYLAWAQSKSLSGPDAAFDADPDHDGIRNGIEFVLGLEPGVASTTGLPTVSDSGENLVFTFRRTAASAFLNPRAETSEGLTGVWTPVTTGISVAPGDPDIVTVTIPKNGRTKLFVRLAVTQ